MNYYLPVPMKNKKFEAGHLEASKELFSLNHPNYNEASEYNMRFTKRTIMDIDEPDTSDIVNTSFSGGLTQSARINGQGEYAVDVKSDIKTYGYKLDKMPISVVIGPDKKSRVCNGRTRIQELKASGFKNMVVDVFETDSWFAFHLHSIKSNPKPDPASPHMMPEIELLATKAVRNGDITNEYSPIFDVVKKAGGSSFKKKTYDTITNRVLTPYSPDMHLAAFDAKTSKEWLQKNGHPDNLNNNGIYYFPYASSSPVKIYSSVANYYIELLNNGKSVKELRIILHTGILDGADGATSWKNRIDVCRKSYTDNFTDIENTHFSLNKKDGDKRNDVVKLYGALPAVAALANEWPLDKLVLFNKGILKNKSFQDITVNNSLDDYFEAA